MDAWKQLVNTALLGTEKLPLTPEALPPRIQEKLINADKTNPEGYFMKAATLMLAYKKAGEQAATSVMPAIVPAEEETLPYCSPNALVVLKKLLSQQNQHLSLISFWAETCIANNWIIPPDMLVAVLDLGADKKARFIRDNIRKIIGKRGEWMVQFNENWQYALPLYEDKLWQEGRIAERREAFAVIRHLEPSKAFEWLNASWAEETAKDRKDFLLMFEKNISLSEEEFLQEVKAALMADKNLEKAINKEILGIVEMLLQRIEKLKQKNQHVAEKSGFLSGLFKKIVPSAMSDVEKEFLAEVKWQNYDETNKKLEQLGHLSWSAEFSQKVLEGIKPDQTNYYQVNYYAPLILELCRCLHPQTANYLNGVTQSNSNDWQFNQYKERVVNPLLGAFDTIAEIEQL